jgi:hypothetical protein
MNIEKELFPESDELKIDENSVATFQIVDMELDPIDCKIDEEDVVILDVSKYSYISLSYFNVEKLCYNMCEMNMLYESQTRKRLREEE